jgi:hypothetical protein
MKPSQSRILIGVVSLMALSHIACANDKKAEKNAAIEAAEQRYLQDLADARKRYIEGLKESLKDATYDELDRIFNERRRIEAEAAVTPVVKAHRKIQGSRWTWVSSLSGSNSTGLEFFPNNRIRLGGVDIGAWAMVEPYILVMRTDSMLWVLEFNKDYTTYKIGNFKPAKHNIQSGRRLTPVED